MKLESLQQEKFQKLTAEQVAKINGGWTVIYADQRFGVSNNSGMVSSGEYGYPSVLGIRTGANEFRATDVVSDVGWN